MRFGLLPAAILSLAVVHSAVQAQEARPRPEGLKALGHFVGGWNTTATNKVLGDQGKSTIQESTAWIAKERFIVGRESSQPDGVKSLWVMSYDEATKSYPFLYFNNKESQGTQWSSTWDEATQTMSGKATDTPQGWTSGARNHFADKDTNRAAFWMKDAAGKTLFDVEATKTRLDDQASERILAAWSKQEQAEPPLPPEMAVLGRLVGSWESTAVSKPAEWTPKEVKTTRTYTLRSVLDGRLVEGSGTASDGLETYTLWTFDPAQKVYRYWWFSSAGQQNKLTGKWDAASETLSFTSDIGNGHTLASVIHLVGADQHDSQVTVKDGQGKVFFHSEGTATRVKE